MICILTGNLGGKRRKRDIDRAVNELVESMYHILQSIEVATEVLGDESWLSVGDPLWLTYVCAEANIG